MSNIEKKTIIQNDSGIHLIIYKRKDGFLMLERVDDGTNEYIVEDCVLIPPDLIKQLTKELQNECNVLS